MRFTLRYTPVPNDLIDDTRLHYTSKLVYTALALSRRSTGLIRLTVAGLEEKTGLCEATVLQGLSELEAASYIRRKRNWRYSLGLGRLVVSSNTYKLRSGCPSGYTLIPASVFDLDLTPAGFCVLLFLYRCAGRSGRAHPSIRYIAGAWREKAGLGLEMAKSTVQRALKELAAKQAFVKHNCEGRDGDLRCNSYYLTDMVLDYKKAHSEGSEASTAENSTIVGSCDSAQKPTPKNVSFGGGPIFGEASQINKITGDHILRKKELGVDEFGNLTKKAEDWLREHPLWFNGQAYLVSFCDELELFA